MRIIIGILFIISFLAATLEDSKPFMVSEPKIFITFESNKTNINPVPSQFYVAEEDPANLKCIDGSEENIKMSQITDEILPYCASVREETPIIYIFDFDSLSDHKRNTFLNSCQDENVNWWQCARVDTTNGNTITQGNNPTGDNGAVDFSGAGPERPGWLGYYVWMVRNTEGYVRYYRINLTGITSADSIILLWQIHGTSSGGRSYTYWFVDLNGNRINVPETLNSATWTTWTWRPSLSYWRFNSSNNYFKIGLQSRSGTVMAVKRIYIYVYGVRRTGIEEDINFQKNHFTFNLFSNYPNPFSNKILISYFLPKECEVNLKVLDASGKTVVTLFSGKQKSGFYNVIWNVKETSQSQLPNGVYFCRLEAGEFKVTKKIIKAE